MTNQEKVQLTLMVKAEERTNYHYFHTLTGAIMAIFLYPHESILETIMFLFMVLYFGLNFFYAMKAERRFDYQNKKLDQFSKQGKTFDEAYVLLFE